MKRLVTLLLALCMIFALAACGGSKTMECEVCGKTAKCTKITIEGESGWVCADCEETLNGLMELADQLS